MKKRDDEHTRRTFDLARKIRRWEISPLEAGLRLGGLIREDETYDMIAAGNVALTEFERAIVIWRDGKIVRKIPLP